MGVVRKKMKFFSCIAYEALLPGTYSQSKAVNKQPLEKVNVTIEHAIGGRFFSSRSNIDGVARMRLFPGRYLMNYIYKQGYSDQWSQDAFMIEKGKTERLEYELMGQPKITGVVRDENRKERMRLEKQFCHYSKG